MGLSDSPKNEQFKKKYILVWINLFYEQRRHFASLVCPHKSPYNVGSCPYQENELSDQFDTWGNDVGIALDHLEKVVTQNFNSTFHTNFNRGKGNPL